MNNPICGTKQSKLWGWTQCLYKGPLSETHLLFIGGKPIKESSKHKHNGKWNRFFIISGTLVVTVWVGGLPQRFILNDGEYIDIKPGVSHKFELLEEDGETYCCECLEIYWINHIDSEDINREEPVAINSPIDINPYNPYPVFVPDPYDPNTTNPHFDHYITKPNTGDPPPDIGFQTFVEGST